MTKRSLFRYFKTSPEIIRVAGMMYVRFPLSLRSVEGDTVYQNWFATKFSISSRMKVSRQHLRQKERRIRPSCFHA